MSPRRYYRILDYRLIPRTLLALLACSTSSVQAQGPATPWPVYQLGAEHAATLPGELQLPVAHPHDIYAANYDSRNPPPMENLPPSNHSVATAPPPTTSESPIMDPTALLLPDVWQTWLFNPVWDAGLELGINATEGNSEALSFRTGGNVSRKTEAWELKSNVIYAKSSASGIETQHNAIFNTGYERFLPATPWSHFGKLNLEYDEFKAFDMRLAMNTGLGYQFVKTEVTTVKGRFGAGVSHEIDSPDTRWVPEAVLGGDFVHQISTRQKLVFTADYFPEWRDFTNYRVVTDMALTLALDDASKLNLKLSVNDRYDSTPNGRKPNDVIYALLLLWQP